MKAYELKQNDVMRMNLFFEVLTVTPVDKELVKVKIAVLKVAIHHPGLQDAGTGDLIICDSNEPNEQKPANLEFTDDGHVLEFICKANREFSVLRQEAYRGNDMS